MSVNDNDSTKIEELIEAIEKHKEALLGILEESAEPTVNPDKELEDSIEHVLKKEELEELKSIRQLRERFAKNTFCFMCLFTGLVLIIVLFTGMEFLKLQAIPLASLIGTVPASMALFGWILRGLFPTKLK